MHTFSRVSSNEAVLTVLMQPLSAPPILQLAGLGGGLSINMSSVAHMRVAPIQLTLFIVSQEFQHK